MVDFLDYVEYDSLTEKQKRVVDCIGMDEFIQLVRLFDGKAFTVPEMKSITTKIKRRIILDDYFVRHLSCEEVSKKHNITLYYAKEILRKTEKRQRIIAKNKTDKQKRNQGIIHDRSALNFSTEQLAEKYSLSKTQILEILKNYAIDSQIPDETAIKNDPIIQDYLEGELTIPEISEKHGISKSALCRKLRAAKVANRAEGKSIKTRNRNAKLIADYNTHQFTIRELAQKYNISDCLVYIILKEKQNKQ